MKKKILAVILTLAMVMTLFVGCGKKDSTYFKEVKEMCKITTGTAVTELNLTYSGEKNYDVLKDKDGSQSMKVKYETTMESQKKAGVKISLKFGQEEHYSELTTIVIDEKTLYLTVSPMVETIKKIDPSMAGQVQALLTQMAIGDSVSLNLEQLMTAMGTEMPEASEDVKKDGMEFLNTVFETVEKHFGILQGQDGDDYTLTFNGDNADEVMDAVIAFLTNDAQNLVDEYNNIVEKVYGSDNEMTKQIKTMTDKISKQIPDAAESIKNSKKDVVKEMKDSKVNIVSKVQVSGKNGSRVGKISLTTGDIESDGEKANVSITSEIKEGKPEIKGMIPENASDITTMLVTMLNMYSSYGIDAGGIGGADSSTDMLVE